MSRPSQAETAPEWLLLPFQFDISDANMRA
jgi:hypothetical protein